MLLTCALFSMFKLIIFATWLSVVLATKPDDVYGTWNVVALVPGTASTRNCNQMIIEQEPHNECSCAAGKIATLVKYSGINREKNQTEKSEIDSIPLITVDSSNHNHAGVNVDCTCSGKQYRTAMVARLPNPEYLVIIDEVQRPGYVLMNSVTLFAKRVPTLAQLNRVILNTDELKNRTVNWRCASDIRE